MRPTGANICLMTLLITTAAFTDPLSFDAEAKKSTYFFFATLLAFRLKIETKTNSNLALVRQASLFILHQAEAALIAKAARSGSQKINQTFSVWLPDYEMRNFSALCHHSLDGMKLKNMQKHSTCEASPLLSPIFGSECNIVSSYLSKGFNF